MAEKEAGRVKGSAADLLSEWRAAERDTVAARESLEVASLAATAAEEAVVAARETGESARLSSEAAQRAENSASRTADAAALTAKAAVRAHTSANDELDRTMQAESDAADRYHEAEREGFPKA